MNDPKVSKINWTSAITAGVTILFLAGAIPAQYQTQVLLLVGIFAPTLIATFRTWYTDKRGQT